MGSRLRPVFHVWVLRNSQRIKVVLESKNLKPTELRRKDISYKF